MAKADKKIKELQELKQKVELDLRTGPQRVLLVALAAVLGSLPGCTKRKEGATPQSEKPQPTVDVTADREAARQSWLLGLARDPAPLLDLAKANPGWRQLFTGNPREALEAFEGATDVDGRIARAVAALSSLEAHQALTELLRVATPALLKAQATRPEAAATAPWRAFIEARLTGKAATLEGPAAAPGRRWPTRRRGSARCSPAGWRAWTPSCPRGRRRPGAIDWRSGRSRRRGASLRLCGA
ncbi:MAG: hypothetical protein R3F43_28500 [bacterium]